MDYVLVAENEDEQPIELPLEEDQTLLLSTVDAQFPGASGIKFMNPSTGAPRGVRLASKKFHPPEKEGGWGDRTYYCVFPKGAEKRKKEDGDEEGAPVSKEAKTIPTPKCTDLIVLGLPWETKEDALRDYFENNFGKLTLAQIKVGKNGKSRGFGFVRFQDYDAQKKALTSRHQIDGRWCDVSLPPSARMQGSPKVFVGRLTEQIEPKHLKEYFCKLGDVTDCFIPKPFRGFGFVTFLDPEVAKIACKMESHEIQGVQVNVETASPKPDQGGGFGHSEGRFRGNQRDRSSGMRDRGGNNYGDDDWKYSQRQDTNRYGVGGGRGNNQDRGGTNWNNGGFNRGEDSYLDSPRGGGSSRIDLRGMSPTRLVSAIKDAGLADVLGLAAAAGGGFPSRGFSDDRGMGDNGFGRASYSGGGGSMNSSRYDRKASSGSNWASYDRYDR